MSADARSDDFPAPPALLPMTRIACEVGAVVSLGPTTAGERRYVSLLGGRVAGPELNGEIVAGGVDWQVLRSDGVIEIAAHYVIRADDGALIEVKSEGYRHGPPEVLALLARGMPVERDAMYFRTAVRFTTGAPAWQHLNKTLALACGARDAALVRLDLYRIT
ncbi:MAG: hypothetical protein RIQ60_3876 [Pseudomonadota bacterium]|jgi:hypothetical protein